MGCSGREDSSFKRQAVVPITIAVATVGNGQHVSDNRDDHNSYHVEEVMHSGNDHR